jgi:hypothetical protein
MESKMKEVQLRTKRVQHLTDIRAPKSIVRAEQRLLASARKFVNSRRLEECIPYWERFSRTGSPTKAYLKEVRSQGFYICTDCGTLNHLEHSMACTKPTRYRSSQLEDKR